MAGAAVNGIYQEALSRVQGCLSSAPVIVLGSGHSAAAGLPGMTELADHLLARVPAKVPAADEATWQRFEGAVRRLPLEAALHEVQLGAELMDIVIRETWECVAPGDRAVVEGIIRNACEVPLARLYDHLFRSTRQRLSVVTTNYDRLAEYAADSGGYGWSTGFGHGYVGRRYAGHRLTFYKGSSALRMVDIWKVHGSLDWFRAVDGTMYSLPATATPPDGFSPVIVAPGLDKYRRTHEEPFRSTIAGADAAIEAGDGFLCVGYGFNDEHVQPKLLERCRRQGKTVVVLAKQLTEAAKRVLLDGQIRQFTAFEESPGGTRMFAPGHIGGIQIDGVPLWSLSELLDKAL